MKSSKIDFKWLPPAYQYDSLERLTAESSSYLTVSLGWDLVGNPASRTENGTNTSYTLGTGNRLSSWTGGSYGHNAAGCVTQITDTAGTRSLAWNSQYQLTAVSTNGTTVEAYSYDSLGRKVATTTAGETTYHVYDGMHMVADLDYSGGLVRSYQPGPGVDNWLEMTVYTGTVAQTYYYLTDHVGIVHALADTNGVIVESYRYDAWGRVLGVFDRSGTPLTSDLGLPTTGIGNRYLWQGREYSWTTGLYYFRARWYDPVLGRWLSKDPIGINGGWNQYVFCGNNPVIFVDPLGLLDMVFFEEGSKIAKNAAKATSRANGFFSVGIHGTFNAFWDTREGEGHQKLISVEKVARAICGHPNYPKGRDAMNVTLVSCDAGDADSAGYPVARRLADHLSKLAGKSITVWAPSDVAWINVDGVVSIHPVLEEWIGNRIERVPDFAISGSWTPFIGKVR